MFLPARVADAVVEYRNTVAAITAPEQAKDMYPPRLYNAADPQMELSTAFLDVWKAMRDELGTDRLSERTLKLVGRPSSPLDDIEKAKDLSSK